MIRINERLTVSVCMGSSCFLRGNNTALIALQEYVMQEGLGNRVELKGNLCEEKCTCGPNMKIGETKYKDIDPESVVDILREYLDKRGL